MLLSSLLIYVFAATTTLAALTTDSQTAHQAAGTDLSKPTQVAPVSAAVAIPATSAVAKDEATANWAGVALTFGPDAVVESVTGTFTVPFPNIPLNGDDDDVYASSAWLGIDGYSCESALLRTGVEFINADGIVAAFAWYEWFPNITRTYYDDISVSPGDVIIATVTAWFAHYGMASIINNSTGEHATVILGGLEYAPLCRESGEWIVGGAIHPNDTEVLLPLPDFGTVTFSGAIASVFDLKSPVANILNIVRDGNTLTYVSTEFDTVTIGYIGE
ncbi:concanavalin A-like lectin/glucanase [Cubamyces sp. BRFM 1775]|nr:concanavalin A-like lectin/glucanase [Cubamyces sp. BRFM 1775]